MSLSSIAFNSMQNAMASAYAQGGGGAVRGAVAETAASASAVPSNVVSIREAGAAQSGGRTVLAVDLGNLLQGLAADDVAGSQRALATFAEHLAARGDEGGTSSGLPALLGSLSARLDDGNTAGALADVQRFLLRSGQVRGTGFSATV